MLTRKNNFMILIKKQFINISSKSIHANDLKMGNKVFDENYLYGTKTPEDLKKFEAEYCDTHWLSLRLQKITDWIRVPFQLGIWDTDRDTELGKFAWNVNGGYPNRLANVLFRSTVLHNRKLMDFAVRIFEHRQTLEMSKSEEPPKISTNSVFLYKDSSHTTVNRRAVERYTIFLILGMAWNVHTALAYFFLAGYLQIAQKNLAMTQSVCVRLDLLPDTEQLHVMKAGIFGFPTSELINIKDLVKIEKEEDLHYATRWYKSRVWIPIEDENLIFKDIKTDVVYTFHKRGIWNDTGISHKLLN